MIKTDGVINHFNMNHDNKIVIILTFFILFTATIFVFWPKVFLHTKQFITKQHNKHKSRLYGKKFNHKRMSNIIKSNSKKLYNKQHQRILSTITKFSQKLK